MALYALVSTHFATVIKTVGPRGLNKKITFQSKAMHVVTLVCDLDLANVTPILDLDLF